MAITMRALGDWLRSHRPLLVDTLLAAALIGTTYNASPSTAGGEDLTYAQPFGGLPGFQVAFAIWCLVAFLVLSLARTRPRWVCWAVPGLLLIHLIFFPVTSVAPVVTCYGMFLLGRYASPRWRRPAWIAAMVGTALAVQFRVDLASPIYIFIVVTGVVWMVLGFFWFLGTRSRSRDLEMKSLRDRAALAAISERTRIAREMHDIVAHSLTAIIVQADGGRYAGKKDPDQAMNALDTIAGTARQSLDQMRDLLSVLRDAEEGDGEDLGIGSSSGSGSGTDGGTGSGTARDSTEDNRRTSPGLVTLPQLIQEARTNGLRVDFSEEGERYQLDPTRQLTIYRIVQECLTNALRYSASGDASVQIVWGAREVVIAVHNEMDAATRFSRGSGRGLTGVRERAELHGGRIEIDRHDGFTVTARIPRK